LRDARNHGSDKEYGADVSAFRIFRNRHGIAAVTGAELVALEKPAGAYAYDGILPVRCRGGSKVD
jgi:hypothetical protein